MAGRFSPAQRAGVGLLIGIAGCSGSGKTLSALRVARGLAGGDDARIAFIDTEAGRALHYAPSPGEAPGAATFGFAHAPLSEPFTPEAYLELIEEADQSGFAVIVIDSFSHVWNGDGGLQDIQEVELDKLAGDEAWKREKMGISAWKGPKTRHKRMVSRLLQCHAHLVICMRAEDKMRVEQVEDDRGRTKTKITPADKLPPSERWSPICEKRFPYELITSLVLSPDQPGVPIPLKLQAQHRPFVPLDRPLDERVGEQLAAWARGAKPVGMSPAAHMHREPEAPPARPPHFVHWGEVALNPDAPQTLELFPGADATEWKAAGAALRAVIERASTPGFAITWWDLNQLQFRGRSPALANWIGEAVPRPEDADGSPFGQGAGIGASSPTVGADVEPSAPPEHREQGGLRA
jgi:hypothetical protein